MSGGGKSSSESSNRSWLEEDTVVLDIKKIGIAGTGGGGVEMPL